MGFLNRIFGQEQRAVFPISDPHIAGMLSDDYGGFLNLHRASGHAVAHRCIQVQAENMAAVPLWLYRRTGNGGREVAHDHPLNEVLHDRPNETMTAYELRESLIASMLIHGNAFARIEWNERGQVTALHPLLPGSVSVERLETGRLRYRVSEPGGGLRVLSQDEVLHLRYRSRDGIMGLSPLQICREAVTRALAETDQATKQAGNGYRPTGALVFPQTLTREQWAVVKDSNTPFAHRDGGGVLILDGGIEFKPFSIPAKDSEFLESRKLSNLDICRVYGVPPTVAGITDHSTYSNSDQESRALVARCLAPMARRIEQAMSVALLPVSSRRTMFIEHDLAGLLRGDMTARYSAYKTGRDGGWLSVNEIRGWENLPDIDGGDEYLSPLNMTPAGARPADGG